MRQIIRYSLLVLLLLSFQAHAELNHQALEKQIDLSHLTKSIVARFANNFGGGDCRLSASQHLSAKNIHKVAVVKRAKSNMKSTVTGESAHFYKLSYKGAAPNGHLFNGTLETSVMADPYNENEELVAHIKIWINNITVKEFDSSRPATCLDYIQGHRTGNNKVAKALNVPDIYVRDIYLPKRKYSGNKQVFAAQKILADPKFELISKGGVDGISGPKTLEAFSIFNALIDEPISFEGKFTSSVIAQMKEASEIYNP